MRRNNAFISAAALAALLLAGLSVKAGVVAVSGASGPWDTTLNPGYNYGIYANGQQSVNLAPTVVPLTGGGAITITSLTPGQSTLLAGANGTVWSDANGVPGWIISAGSPAAYIPGTLYLEELVGTFADNGVIVGAPFAIGNGPTTQTIPAGANQLLMGVADNWYNDNGGSVQVSVSAVPEPSTLIAGLGALGLALAGLGARGSAGRFGK